MNADKQLIQEYLDALTLVPVIDFGAMIEGFEKFKKSKSIIDKGFDYEVMRRVEGVITEIKRLSDDVVFKVGDKTNRGIIIRIKPHHTHGIYFYCVDNNDILGASSILFIEALRKVLFVSADGVNIYDGDIFWFVDRDFNYVLHLATEVSVSKQDLKTTFSTKKAADEFFRMNKPNYSLKEISDLLIKLNVIPVHGEKIIDELKKLKP